MWLILAPFVLVLQAPDTPGCRIWPFMSGTEGTCRGVGRRGVCPWREIYGRNSAIGSPRDPCPRWRETFPPDERDTCCNDRRIKSES